MHSRIYELKEDPNVEDELCEDTLESSFYDRYGIDYTDECTGEEYTSSMDWFGSAHGDCVEINKEEKSVVFKDITGIMEHSYNTFMETLEKLQNCTIEQFTGEQKMIPGDLDSDAGHLLWRLNDAWASHSEFYVYHDGYAQPLLDWLRNLSEEDRKKKYYFGGILDYHI